MKYIAILLVFIQINAFGLDLEFYLRIPIPTNIANAGAGGASMVSIPTVVSRNDGAFIFQDLSLPKFGIAVRPNKTFFYYCPKDEYYTQTNKIISSTIQGNTRIDISESTLLLGSIKTNPDLILKTISNNGVIIELSTNETKSVSVNRVVSSIQPAGFISGQQISESSIKESALVIEKYDSKQNIIESKSFNSNINDIFKNIPTIVQLPTNINFTNTSQIVYDAVKNTWLEQKLDDTKKSIRKMSRSDLEERQLSLFENFVESLKRI